MKWSWTIGRVAGIKLRVHATFLIILAWLAIIEYRASGSIAGAVTGVVFTVALFASVVLHELGHALSARHFGVPTRDITLLPIGGVARLDFIPDKPRQELAIALAGPAVTALIALVLLVALWLVNPNEILVDETVIYGSTGAFIAELMWLNVVLLLFNLLPAFPMDGGRVLRALLGLHMEYQRATDIAARIGRGFALVFALVGLLYNPILVLIALFIWISAAGESAALHERFALKGVAVNRLMIRDVRTLAPTDTLNDALRHALGGFQDDFPVVEGERLLGVLTRADLLAGVARAGPDSAVAEAMEPSFRTADPEELVTDALSRLRESRCRTLPVVTNGKLCGLLTMENISEYVMIDAALKTPSRQPYRRGLERLNPSYK
jgi:Zn-dependent protease/CBS domain-containing protein